MRYLARLLIGMGLVVALSAAAGAQDEGKVDFHSDAWGESCPDGGRFSPDSYAVKLVNNTGKTVDIRICLERKGGDWDCTGGIYVAPGLVVPASWSWAVCHGTGEAKWWWRDAGDTSVQWPKP